MQYWLLRSTHFSYRICAICYLDVNHALHVSVRIVLYEALGLFLTCSQVSLFTMLSFKCAVDFSSNKQLEQNLLFHGTDVLQKRLQKSCHLYFYSIKDKEIRLETRYLAISSISFFSVDESFLWRCYGVTACVRPRT